MVDSGGQVDRVRCLGRSEVQILVVEVDDESADLNSESRRICELSLERGDVSGSGE